MPMLHDRKMSLTRHFITADDLPFNSQIVQIDSKTTRRVAPLYITMRTAGLGIVGISAPASFTIIQPVKSKISVILDSQTDLRCKMWVLSTFLDLTHPIQHSSLCLLHEVLISSYPLHILQVPLWHLQAPCLAIARQSRGKCTEYSDHDTETCCVRQLQTFFSTNRQISHSHRICSFRGPYYFLRIAGKLNNTC